MLRLRGGSCFAAALAAALMLVGPASAQVTNTLIDFEAPGFDATNNTALDEENFLFFFSSTGGAPGFEDFSGLNDTAPNLDISNPTIVTVAFTDDENNDALDGNQSLVFFADTVSPLFQDDPIENNDPRNLNLFVFQQQTITATDIGASVDFSFLFSGAPDAVNTNPNTTVEAFLVTLDPEADFATTNELAFDLSDGVVGQTESGLLELALTDPLLEGQLLQFGVRNSFADGENPAVIVDNLQLIVEGGTLAGDFNGDGAVDALDYLAFRDGASPNGPTSTADFNLFVDNFGAGAPALQASVAAVPEPSALLLALIGIGATRARRR